MTEPEFLLSIWVRVLLSTLPVALLSSRGPPGIRRAPRCRVPGTTNAMLRVYAAGLSF